MKTLHFSKEALDCAINQPIDSCNILIYINPKDFLSLAMSGHSEEKMATVKELMTNNISFNEIPFLNFVHDGEGTARVTGHEGRHRAKILQSLNITEMPVLLKHRYDENGQAMLWHKMNSSKNKFYDMWPERLYGERGYSDDTNKNNKNYIVFPVPDLRIDLDKTLKIKI